MQMETWLLQTLTEKLVALPFECALQTVQYVMTLGADGFLTFIQANILEAGVMIVKRVTLDPVRFRLLRLLRFRINVQLAQRAGSPVPVMTPELEAIGIMTDMLSLMYRYSVDTLGSVISPITIAVLFLFREEFEINKLVDLLFFERRRKRYRASICICSNRIWAVWHAQHRLAVLHALLLLPHSGFLGDRHLPVQYGGAPVLLEAL